MKWKSFKHAVNQDKDDADDEEDWWRERIKVQMTTDKGLNVLIPQKENLPIVKFLGRTMIQEYLEPKIKKLWAKNGQVIMIDVGGGF